MDFVMNTIFLDVKSTSCGVKMTMLSVKSKSFAVKIVLRVVMNTI